MKATTLFALLGLLVIANASVNTFLSRIKRTTTENYVCSGVGKPCGGTTSNAFICCPGSQCEDNFNGHGVCVAIHTEATAKPTPTTENFVCSGVGQPCGGTTSNAFICCPGSQCEDNFNGHGVCVAVHSTVAAKKPTTTENFVCSGVGQPCGGTTSNAFICCPGSQCEDNFNGHGVCVAVHTTTTVKPTPVATTTENFVCSGVGKPCGGTTSDAFICCPGSQCEDNFNGHGVCVAVHTEIKATVTRTENFVCSGVGKSCGGENDMFCCPGYECEDNFNGHGVCIRSANYVCSKKGEACGGVTYRECCEGSECGNFNGLHGVCQ